MKYIIASDIHGSYEYCALIIDRLKTLKADKIILLGDLLYHGPRNSFPICYDPQTAAKFLNKYKERIICVRGNCDSEVDQMMLEFPIMADYAILSEKGKTIYLTHGHIYNEKNPLPMAKGDIMINGHTHIPALRDHGDYIYMNPGSVALPKTEPPVGSYIVLEDGVFEWRYTHTDETFMTYKIED